MSPTADQSAIFYNFVRAQGHCDVLLDPLAQPPCLDRIDALCADIAPRQHLRDPFFDERPTSAPLLVRLPLSEMALLDELMAHAFEQATSASDPLRGVCGFLRSTLPHAVLAARLSRSLNLQVGPSKIYFRFFDPRIVHHMPRLLPPALHAETLCGVTHWAYPSWEGTIEIQQVPHRDPHSRAPSGALRMQPDLWRRFGAIEHFNAVVRTFLQHELPCPVADTAMLFAQVEAALATGLTEANDVGYYLACCKSLDEQVSRHEAWPAVLTLVRAEVPLADALRAHCGIDLYDSTVRMIGDA